MLISLTGCLVFMFFLQQLVHCETTQNRSINNTESEKHFSKEAELIFELLKDYETHVRPAKSAKATTQVSVSMNLKQIISLDEKEELLTTSLYMYYTWQDDRLKWDKENFDKIVLIRLPSNTIWTPDIILTNTVDGNMQESMLVNALVYDTGVVEWLPLSIFKTSCSIRIAHFPFDQQTCSLVFKSAGYYPSQLNLSFAKDTEGKEIDRVQVDNKEFVPHGEWDLIDSPVEMIIPNSKTEATEIRFTLVTKRKPLFYTLNMLLPCILLTVLSCFTFYLPSAAGEKISLGISLLIGDTIFIFLFAQRMPSTSFSVPLIAAYLLYTALLLSTCVVTSTFVLSIHWRSNSSHNKPIWLKDMIFIYLKKFVGMGRTNHGKNIFYTGRKFRDTHNSHDKTNGFKNSNCSYVDKLSSDAYYTREARRFGLFSNDYEYDGKTKEKTLNLPEVKFTTDVPYFIEKSFSKIKLIGSLLKKDHDDQLGKDEWGQIAEIIDRFFMWLYLCLFTFGTLAFYGYVHTLQ